MDKSKGEDKEAKKTEQSGEIESDPMKGVKEIKGADEVAKVPEAVIDVKKHQDALDPDSVKNETATIVPTGIPDAAAPKPQETDTKPEEVTVKLTPEESPKPAVVSAKPSHKVRNCCLIFLLFLCFLCVACVGATYAFRDRLFQFVTNSVARQDPTLKTITKDQVTNSNVDLPTLIDQKTNAATVDANGEYTISFTEAELLSAIMKDANNSSLDPTAVGLKFSPGNAKLQIDIGKLLAHQNTSQVQSNIPIDLSLLNGVIINADIAASADGTKLMIQDLSTGNPVLDALIPKDSLSGLNNQLDLTKLAADQNGSDPASSINIKKIEFQEGLMVLTIQK